LSVASGKFIGVDDQALGSFETRQPGVGRYEVTLAAFLQALTGDNVRQLAVEAGSAQPGEAFSARDSARACRRYFSAWLSCPDNDHD
jgi:hypothetical protein